MCVFSVSYSGTQDITTALYQHLHLERSRTFTRGSQKSCSQPQKTFLMILVLTLSHLKCDFQNFYPGISVFGSLENNTFGLCLDLCFVVTPLTALKVVEMQENCLICLKYVLSSVVDKMETSTYMVKSLLYAFLMYRKTQMSTQS